MGTLIEIIFFIDTALFVGYIFYKIFLTIFYSKAQIPTINNGSLALGDSLIQEVGDNLIKYLKSDLTFEYSNEYYYSSIYHHLDKKQKKIVVPQWKQVSAGYEFDYVLASIWFNSMLFSKNKYINFWKLLTTTIPSVCRNIFLLCISIIAIMYFMDHYASREFLVRRHFLIETIEMTALIIFFITVMIYFSCIIFGNNSKTIIEGMYEKDLASFFKTELRGYVEDIVAARTYSVNIQKINFQIMRFNIKTENAKYFGPFSII